MLIHDYTDGVKAYDHVRLTLLVGRRGKPVRKFRTMPMEHSLVLPKMRQGHLGNTVSVV